MDDLDLGSTVKGLLPGQKVFGRYTLTRVLGRGGMGVVWLARDESLEREVAMKFLPEVVAADPRAVDELKRETRRSLQLTHPHIVRIYDFVEDARTAAIAMEFIPGATLSKLVLEQPQRAFAPGALAVWVKQLCEALDYAHRKAKVVHRDLKPANLMIDGAGELKVADFGIAASVSDSVSRVSQQAGTSGTPVYMSPQQMMGEKPAVTDDIYALGATLYDLLTGKPPFYTGNVILQVQNKVPPSLAERRAELGVGGEPIPPAWEATIAACLAKEPKDRPQSAAEVWERLQSGDSGLRSASAQSREVAADDGDKADQVGRGLSHTPPAVAGQSRIEKRKSKILAAGAAIAVVAAAGWWFGIHVPEQRRLAVERQQVEEARIERERTEAEARRLAEEREAEARRIEAARIAAVEEAERRRIADEQARLEAARGGVVVRTTPAGAEVRVGAVALEKSPMTLKDLRLGNYPVRVRLEGYEDWDGEVAVKENDFAEVNVALVRSTGIVKLATEPAGLDYVLRGEVTRTGRTPAELTLPTGRYNLTFSRPGWPEQVRTVEVKRNEQVQAGGDFVGGAIELTSTPSGAEVWQNGRQLGTTPYRVPDTLPGRYDYELRLAKYRVATAALTVETRKTARENVQLTANPVLAATRDAPFENSLGMRFVPVPGTNVLFSIWETREQDYAAFVLATGRAWRNANSGATHPAVNVAWEDAVAFCRWLTQEERRSGRLGPQETYRLPTDEEWSAAVGLGDEPGRTPEEKNEKVKSLYPWGTQWPPPSGAGNYARSLAVDSFSGTSPVGSFATNAQGLHDLGGNVWEWMQDEWRPGAASIRVLRGASFGDDVPRNLLASRRAEFARSSVYPYAGFRVVLEPMVVYRSPDLQILGAQAVDGEGRTIILPGTQARVTVRIKNLGEGKAEDVVVTLARGENVFFTEDFKAATLTRSLGTLRAGEHRDVEVDVLPNNRATAFPLTASLSEASGRYSVPARDLGLVLNRPSPGLVPAVLGSEGSDLLQGIPRVAENPNAIAVIIGNSTYQGDIPPVPFAANDAAVTRHYVEQALGIRPANIIMLNNATGVQFRVTFGVPGNSSGRLRSLVRPGLTEVFVFYSGHGGPDASTRKAYLMPVDAHTSFISTTGYSVDLLFENLAALGAKHVTVVLDAAFSGTTGRGEMLIRGGAPLAISIGDPTTRFRDGSATVIAAAEGQQGASWDEERKHGLLTYFFLKGLQGAADKDANGAITAGEMRAWLTDSAYGIPYESRRLQGRDQTPQVFGNASRTIRPAPVGGSGL